jgi:hypothetical protein
MNSKEVAQYATKTNGSQEDNAETLTSDHRLLRDVPSFKTERVHDEAREPSKCSLDDVECWKAKS